MLLLGPYGRKRGSLCGIWVQVYGLGRGHQLRVEMGVPKCWKGRGSTAI